MYFIHYDRIYILERRKKTRMKKERKRRKREGDWYCTNEKPVAHGKSRILKDVNEG